MENLFDLGHGSPERPDINLCIFPHLKEFVAIDLRWEVPHIALLNTEDVFGDSFFNQVEYGFGQMLREPTEHPFAHLIDLPWRAEEIVRETGMLFILERLGKREREDDLPTVAVFIISGAALSMKSGEIASALRSLFGKDADPSIVQESASLLERLITQEQKVVKHIDRQELREALEEQSPNFFTLWERRN